MPAAMMQRKTRTIAQQTLRHQILSQRSIAISHEREDRPQSWHIFLLYLPRVSASVVISHNLFSAASCANLRRHAYADALVHGPAAKQSRLVVRPVESRDWLLGDHVPAQELQCARHPALTSLLVLLRALVGVLIPVSHTAYHRSRISHTKSFISSKQIRHLYIARLPSPEASMQVSRSCGRCEQLQTVAPASVSRSHAAKPASYSGTSTPPPRTQLKVRDGRARCRA